MISELLLHVGFEENTLKPGHRENLLFHVLSYHVICTIQYTVNLKKHEANR